MDELHGRKIAFPAAKALADLFSEIKPAQGDAPVLAEFPSWEAGTWSDPKGRTRCQVTGYMYVRPPHRSYHVQARPEVIEHIRANMLHGSNDRIHFAAVIWGDGRALVVAEYSQIIGSSYLAIIDAASIPAARGVE